MRKNDAKSRLRDGKIRITGGYDSETKRPTFFVHALYDAGWLCVHSTGNYSDAIIHAHEIACLENSIVTDEVVL